MKTSPCNLDDEEQLARVNVTTVDSFAHGVVRDLPGRAPSPITDTAGWLKKGVVPSEIAVCARFNVLLDKVHDRLKAAGIPAGRVKAQPSVDVEAVRLASMHAIKGLEFRCVAVVGANAKAVPFAKEITPVEVDRHQHENDMLKERCLLFVACTRAREALAVTWSGPASPFLPPA